MSSTVSNYNPTYVDAQQMGMEEKNPYIGRNRAERINSIIKQCYNTLLSQTDQKQQSRRTLTQLVSIKTNRVYDLRDQGFGEFHTISFTLNTSGFTAGTVYPLLVIKKGTPGTDNISFMGVNSQTAPSKYLNSYGYFIYTYSEMAEEQQVSFYCVSDPGSTSYGCFLNLIYQINQDVN